MGNIGKGKKEGWGGKRYTRESSSDRNDFANESSVMMPFTVAGMKGEALKRVCWGGVSVGMCSWDGSMHFDWRVGGVGLWMVLWGGVEGWVDWFGGR